MVAGDVCEHNTTWIWSWAAPQQDVRLLLPQISPAHSRDVPAAEDYGGLMEHLEGTDHHLCLGISRAELLCLGKQAGCCIHTYL